MQNAYILINCDTGCEEQIIQDLKRLNNVTVVDGVFGVYDIVAKIEGQKADTVRNTVVEQIRQIANIRSTLTLLGTGPEIQKENNDLIPDIIPEEKKPLEPPQEIEEEDEEA